MNDYQRNILIVYIGFAVVIAGTYCAIQIKNEKRKQEVHTFMMKHNQLVDDKIRTQMMEQQINDQ